jgi:hypothetical protein
VREGIDSISLNPDVAIATTLRVAAAESPLPPETRSENGRSAGHDIQ